MDYAYCPKCAQTKPVIDFNRNAARYSGRDSYCRECVRAASRARQKSPKSQVVPEEKQCEIDGCTDLRKGHGLCNRHLKRLREHGDPLAGRKYMATTASKRRPNGLTLEETFRWFMPGEPPEAGIPWLWKGPVDEKGYGTVRHQGRNVFAHRIAYELFVGPIPNGSIIRHKNDVPLDINPHNLITGTRVDNVRDRDERGRAHAGPRSEAMRQKAARGSRHALAKLTEQDIPVIRNAHANGENQQSIADRYGVSQVAISAIVRRKTWTHVP
ncbi:HNH endonuclease signature motif containing protein [Nocardia sp. Marseille-Q1738]